MEVEGLKVLEFQKYSVVLFFLIEGLLYAHLNGHILTGNCLAS